MEWNMGEYLIHCCNSNDYVFSMDYLKNTYDKTKYHDVVKKIKVFKPAVKLEDVIAVGLTDYDGKDPVYGVLFTKDYMYVKNQKAYPLYGITKVSYQQKKVGAFAKKHVTDTSITYKDKTVKLTLDGFFSMFAVQMLQRIYKYGSDGIENPTRKEYREQALEDLRDGVDSLFEFSLEANADDDKDACVLLMNYYYNKGMYDFYDKYKKLAMEKRAPQAYYHEGYLSYKNGYYKEAYKNYLRAYACGIDSSIYPELLSLHKILKDNTKKVRKPYKYMDLDIDPYMFECIYDEKYNNAYIQYLMNNNIKDEVIKKWNQDNYNKQNIIPLEKDEEFYDLLSQLMSDTSAFSVHYYDMNDFKDKLTESLNYHVWNVDGKVMKFLNTIDKLIVTDLPKTHYNDFKLREEKIESFLDMKTYIGEKQYKIYDDPRAYNCIKSLNEYPDFKKKRLNASKQASIAFLESKILEYEDIMTFFKRAANRMIALTYMWATPDTGMEMLAFNRYDYIKEAKERILLIDKKFLEVKNEYLKQMNISDKDLFRKPRNSDEMSLQNIKNEGILLTTPLDSYKEYGYFYVYNNQKDLDYPLKEFMKEIKVKFNKEDILFYQRISSSGYSRGEVLTKDMFYSSYFKQPIPLKNLLALQVTSYNTLVALYEDGSEKVYPHEYGFISDLECNVNFVNEMLIYMR